MATPFSIDSAVTELRSAWAQRGLQQAPDLHAVLGSGIASALDPAHPAPGFEFLGEVPFDELSYLTQASAPGHRGAYALFRHKKTQKVFCVQVGRVHGYEGLPAAEAVRPVLIPALAGTRQFLLSNAAGGLNINHPVGSVMLIDDHVNLTGQNPLVGPVPHFLGEAIGPRFPDLSRGYDREKNTRLGEALSAQGLRVHRGVYLGLLGPSFETPAEVRLFARWGLDAVGMSTVWESIALNHIGAKVCGFSLISNWGCGLDPDHVLDHFAILKESQSAAEKILKALFSWAEREWLA